MAKTESKRTASRTVQYVDINVGSDKAPSVVRAPRSFYAAGKEHGLPDKAIGQAWLRERTKAFEAAQVLSGKNQTRDVDLLKYRAKVARLARAADRAERIAEQVDEQLARAQYVATRLSASERKLLGMAEPKAETETETEATLPQ